MSKKILKKRELLWDKMVSIQKLYNDFLTLMGQKHYTKTQSDEAYVKKSDVSLVLTEDGILTLSYDDEWKKNKIDSFFPKKIY